MYQNTSPTEPEYTRRPTRLCKLPEASSDANGIEVLQVVYLKNFEGVTVSTKFILDLRTEHFSVTIGNERNMSNYHMAWK